MYALESYLNVRLHSEKKQATLQSSQPSCPNMDRVDSCVVQNHAEGHLNFESYVYWTVHHCDS